MRWTLAIPLLLLAAAAAALWASPAHAQSAIIDNGVVQLGVNGPGDLNAPGTTPPPATCNSSVTTVGVRYMPTGCEATADGCTCEGWGAAYNNAVEGCADTSNCGGMIGMTLGSFSSTATTALSVTHIGDLQITHDFHPMAGTLKVYQVNVTLQNMGPTTMDNVTYRRSMDWDIEPSAFSEYSGLETVDPVPTALLHSCLNGFIPELILSNPLPVVCSPPPDCYGGMGPPDYPDVIDSGVCDHGAVFDFNFNSLGPGDTRVFNIYYGAGDDDTDARDVLDLIGAQVWSLGKCSSGTICDASTDPSGHIHGGPQTFIFAFTGLAPTISVVPEFTWEFLTTSPDDLTLDTVQFTDLSTYTATPGSGPVTLSWAWDLVVVTSTAQDPATEYPTAGTYNVCLTFTATLTLFPGVSASGSVCHDVIVHNRPPIAVLANMGGTYGANVWSKSTDEDGTVVSTSWVLCDGTTYSGVRPPITPCGKEGWYTVCLTVTDDWGDTDEACTQVYYRVPNQDVDTDRDGIEDVADNCPSIANHDQADADNDGQGDLCEPAAEGAPDEAAAAGPVAGRPADGDHDGVPDLADDCPAVPDFQQSDLDGDGRGDMCDTDLDGDGVAEQGPNGVFLDNCPLAANADQLDRDGNGVGDACQQGTAALRPGLAGDDDAASVPAGSAQAPASGSAWVQGLAWGAAAFVATAALLVPLALRRRGK